MLIIRTFIKLREIIATKQKHGREITAILQHLIEAPEKPNRRISFPQPDERV